MSVEHQYPVHVSWSKDRMGTLSSPDVDTTITVATPPEFPKGMPNIWSPEHLFTAAVNSCLMTTFLSIAERARLDFIAFDAHASGKLAMVDGKYMMTEVTLSPEVTIANESDRDKAMMVLHKAEENCLISYSIKSTIVFEPKVRVVATAL
jgi:peroxiredoxin-like protein